MIRFIPDIKIRFIPYFSEKNANDRICLQHDICKKVINKFMQFIGQQDLDKNRKEVQIIYQNIF